MLIVVVSHAKDLDGLASAALTVRYAEKHAKEPFILRLKTYDEPFIDESVLGLKDLVVVLSDLAMDTRHYETNLSRIAQLTESGSKVYWFDHHPAKDEERLKAIDEVATVDLRPNDGVCAADVVHSNLYEGNDITDPHAERLRDLARDSDYWRFDLEETRDIVDLIAYLDYLDREHPLRPRLVSYVHYLAFSDSSVMDDAHRDMLSRYRDLREDSLQRAEATLTRIEGPGPLGGVIWYPALVSGSQACHRALSNNEELEYVIGVGERGGASVRRADESELDCAEVAKLFGGGGHPYAAGFSVDDDGVTLEQFEERFRSEIVRKLEDDLEVS